jgi:hypothetical protein
LLFLAVEIVSHDYVMLAVNQGMASDERFHWGVHQAVNGQSIRPELLALIDPPWWPTSGRNRVHREVVGCQLRRKNFSQGDQATF